MHASLLLSVAIVVGAPALKSRPKGNTDIAGEWVVQRVETSGRRRPPPRGELRYIFHADGKLIVARGERKLGGDDRGYTFDPHKNPAALDLVADVTEQEPTITHCIYKIEGDVMTLLIPRGRRERPSKFEVSRESPGTIYTLKRSKTKE